MKIKTYRARNFREAMTLVKKEMGEDAILLSSKERRGGVEIAAAIDYAEIEKVVKSAQAVHASKAIKRNAAASVKPKRVDGLNSLKRELQGLKETIQGIKHSGYEVSLPKEQKEIYHCLLARNINRTLSLDLSERVKNMCELPGTIATEIPTLKGGAGKKAVVMIGPTGVGKTTTIAKLAAKAVKEGKKIALISMDTYRIGAVEQIRIYAKILGVPLDVVSSVGELKESLVKYAGKDAIFIDTTGRNPREKSYIKGLKMAGGLKFSLETHLLLSASSDDLFMTEAYKYYRELPIDCIALSKVDEAVRFGSIYNLVRLYRKPVAYITTGQKVPEDIMFPSSTELARLILKYSAPKNANGFAVCGTA
jgi:flagellar biosynthesis protein FlhF